jgi:hypothetical protein
MTHHTDNVIELSHLAEMIDMAEALVARIRTGQTLAFALVKHQRDGTTHQYASKAPNYHMIHSGVAILAHRLAAMGNFK